MLLAIDIGNTETDFALFGLNEIKHRYRIHSQKDISEEELTASFGLFLESKHISPSDVDEVIVSSVVPLLTQRYVNLSRSLFHCEPKTLGPGLKTGLKIDTDNPKEVGADMIAETLGARELYGAPCLIADFGTATKIMLLDKNGAFAGCTIGAGLGLQERSLSSSAALLPEVSLQIPPKFLGKNTVDCMNSALTYGNAFAAKSLCDAIEKEVGYPCKRVLTGGYASYVHTLFPEFIYEPNLVLMGLRFIAERNRK